MNDDQLAQIACLMWADEKWMARARVLGSRFQEGATPTEAVERALAAHGLTPTPGYCALCGEAQVQTPSGLVCSNGHGGAETVDSPNADLF